MWWSQRSDIILCEYKVIQEYFKMNTTEFTTPFFLKTSSYNITSCTNVHYYTLKINPAAWFIYVLIINCWQRHFITNRNLHTEYEKAYLFRCSQNQAGHEREKGEESYLVNIVYITASNISVKTENSLSHSPSILIWTEMNGNGSLRHFYPKKTGKKRQLLDSKGNVKMFWNCPRIPFQAQTDIKRIFA